MYLYVYMYTYTSKRLVQSQVMTPNENHLQDKIREVLYHLITSNQILGFLLTVICASTLSGSSVCTE